MGEFVTLTTEDGVEISAYVARPDGDPIAALVVVQEIFGVNAHIRSVADGFAKDGFLAVAPALFDRIEKDVELGYDEAGWSKARELAGKLDAFESIKDVAAAVEFARAASGGKVGVIGYCYGGTMAWLAAARLKIRVAVGYYGGQIPRLISEEPNVAVMLHFGSQDTHIPESGINAVAAAHPEVKIYWYDAGHAFNRDADPKAYVAEAAELARERSLAFLRRHLT